MSQLPSLYYGPAGWTDDPDQARIRLDSLIETEVKTTNVLFINNGTSWQTAEDLNGIEAGFFFRVSAFALEELALVRFQSVRALDQEIKQIFPINALVWNQDNIRIPVDQLQGRDFSLLEKDARVFIKRLKAIGAEIIKAEPVADNKQTVIQERIVKMLSEAKALNEKELTSDKDVNYNDRQESFNSQIDSIQKQIEKLKQDYPEQHLLAEQFQDQIRVLRHDRNRLQRMSQDVKERAEIDKRLLLADLEQLVDSNGQLEIDGKIIQLTDSKDPA